MRLLFAIPCVLAFSVPPSQHVAGPITTDKRTSTSATTDSPPAVTGAPSRKDVKEATKIPTKPATTNSMPGRPMDIPVRRGGAQMPSGRDSLTKTKVQNVEAPIATRAGVATPVQVNSTPKKPDEKKGKSGDFNIAKGSSAPGSSVAVSGKVEKQVSVAKNESSATQEEKNKESEKKDDKGKNFAQPYDNTPSMADLMNQGQIEARDMLHAWMASAEAESDRATAEEQQDQEMNYERNSAKTDCDCIGRKGCMCDPQQVFGAADLYSLAKSINPNCDCIGRADCDCDSRLLAARKPDCDCIGRQGCTCATTHKKIEKPDCDCIGRSDCDCTISQLHHSAKPDCDCIGRSGCPCDEYQVTSVLKMNKRNKLRKPDCDCIGREGCSCDPNVSHTLSKDMASFHKKPDCDCIGRDGCPCDPLAPGHAQTHSNDYREAVAEQTQAEVNKEKPLTYDRLSAHETAWGNGQQVEKMKDTQWIRNDRKYNVDTDFMKSRIDAVEAAVAQQRREVLSKV